MKNLKIKPWGNKIQLEFPTTKAGAIVMEQGSSIQEMGTVVALGPFAKISPLKKGQKLLVKTWDVDVITVEDQKFYFISDDSRAICAVVE